MTPSASNGASHPPPSASQKVLGTIVFTDVVGYSERVQRDEDGTLALVRRDLDFIAGICAELGGRVVKNTGDGLLLYFPTATDAVQCALKVQGAFAEAARQRDPAEVLQHCVGIHLGDVFLSEQDVVGDGVNIAARLLGEAEPGGICLSQTVYDVVKNRLTVKATYIGARELKNIREAVPAYRILIDAAAREQVGAPGTPAAPGGSASAAKTPFPVGYASAAGLGETDRRGLPSGLLIGTIACAALGALALGIVAWVQLRSRPVPVAVRSVQPSAFPMATGTAPGGAFAAAPPPATSPAAPPGPAAATAPTSSPAASPSATPGAEVAQISPYRQLTGHRGQVVELQFIAGGKQLLSRSHEREVEWDAIVWDVEAGRPVHPAWRAFDFATVSPDGRYVLFANGPRLGRLEETTSHRILAPFTGEEGAAAGAFFPDSGRLALGCRDDSVRVWDIAAGKESARFPGHNAVPTAIAVSPDGKYIASACRAGDATVRLWDVSAATEARRVATGHFTRSLRFSADGARVLSEPPAGELLTVVTVATGLRTLCKHAAIVRSADLSPDGLQVLAGDESPAGLRLWQLAPPNRPGATIGTDLHRFDAVPGPVRAVAFAAGGKQALIAAGDNSLRLLDVATGKPIARLAGEEKPVAALAVSPDGRLAASAGEDHVIRIWQLPGGK